MKGANVELILPQQDVEGELVALDRNGKEMPVPAKILVRPFFFRQDAVVNVLYMRVVSSGELMASVEDENEVQKAIIQLPGSNGRLRLIDRSRRVTPKFLVESGEEADPSLDIEEFEEDDEDGEDDDE